MITYNRGKLNKKGYKFLVQKNVCKKMNKNNN
jgi:hypothetical protein